MLSRRSALLGLTAAFTMGRASLAFGAAATDKRFVVILLRGAMDGMSAVQPYGDANCADIRGSLALPQPKAGQGALLDLGGFYGLHPSMVNLHAMYAANEALIVHAVAGNYRSRSHFEAQDYMECGVYERLTSGWLNRAVSAMPAAPNQDLALSLGLSAPLLMRGPAHVEAWAPEHFGQDPSADLYTRLEAISDHDPLIGPALREGLRLRGGAAAAAASAPPPVMASADDGAGQAAPAGARERPELVLAATAGRMLATPTGPRIAALEINGWDTHTDQVNRLRQQLALLDGVIGELRAGLGPAWRNTVVLTMTEFGRTARVNGGKGTDHGTASVAFLAGGAVAGGHVRADWPGLGSGRLFEDRDLMPTTDIRAVAKGVLASHLGIGPSGQLQAFPGSGDAPAVSGLIRA
jgi:uncharacterized protein (DUF1501 family)